MNSEIKKIVDPKLYDVFLEVVKSDALLTQLPYKTTSIKEFINALIASVVLMKERESVLQDSLLKVFQANPQLKQIMELRNDPSLLSKESTG